MLWWVQCNSNPMWNSVCIMFHVKCSEIQIPCIIQCKSNSMKIQSMYNFLNKFNIKFVFIPREIQYVANQSISEVIVSLRGIGLHSIYRHGWRFEDRESVTILPTCSFVSLSRHQFLTQYSLILLTRKILFTYLIMFKIEFRSHAKIPSATLL
jgi:hypothetical protein